MDDMFGGDDDEVHIFEIYSIKQYMIYYNLFGEKMHETLINEKNRRNSMIAISLLCSIICQKEQKL